MIIDLEGLPSDSTLDADICVIGAGAVGIAMAVSLAERGRQVLLLEGGGQTLETRSQALQAGESIGHPFENVGIGRYRVLGGTTTYWGGQVLPFDEFVTGARPWLGHAAWPIPATELAKYFQQTYRLLGFEKAMLDDAEVWRSLGQSKPALGDALDVVMTRWLQMRNFARLFSRELRKSTNLRTLVHANVTGMELNGASSRVTGVRVSTLTGRTCIVRAREFVLANGTLEIVRLLKHPLVDGRAAPWDGSPWLGQPLVDHLDCTAGDVKVLDHKRFHQVFDNIYVGGYKYYPKIRLSPTKQREDGLADIAGQFLYRTRFTEHLEYLKMFLRSLREGGLPVSWHQLPQHAAAVLSTTVPLALRYFRDRRSFKPADAEVSLVLYCEQLPDRRSNVSLGDETDALGMRRLKVNWSIDGRELETMRTFARSIATGLQSAGLATVSIDPRLETLDVNFKNSIHDAVHQMGTARIGSSRDDGFVDSNLKVFGIENLYIAGAAVFPSTGFANPTFTAIALGLRLCDHLDSIARD